MKIRLLYVLMIGLVFFFSTYLKAQTASSVAKKYIEGRQSLYFLLKDNTVNLNQLIKEASEYFKDSNSDIRLNALDLTYTLLQRQNQSKAVVLKFLLEVACQDSDQEVRDYFARRLITHDKSNYNKLNYTVENIDLLRKILYDKEKVNFYIIALAGYLNLAKDKDYIRTLAEMKPMPKERRSNKWAAYLALTRMGEDDYINYIMNFINSKPSIDNVSINMKYLTYIQHDRATEYIVQILIGEETFPPTDSGKIEPYALRATRALGKLLINDPVVVGNRLTNYSQIQVARDWIKNRKTNEPWSYNKDNFW